MALINKIPGGYEVDGFAFRRGKCGCGGGGQDCCFTFSKVKADKNTLVFEGKATCPSSTDNYAWGYRVRKDDTVVEVHMVDTHGHRDYYAGYDPPPLADLVAKGWTVEEQYERPLPAGAE